MEMEEAIAAEGRAYEGVPGAGVCRGWAGRGPE